MKRPTRPTTSTTPSAGRALKPSWLHSNAVVYFDAVRRFGSIREAARHVFGVRLRHTPFTPERVKAALR